MQMECDNTDERGHMPLMSATTKVACGEHAALPRATPLYRPPSRARSTGGASRTVAHCGDQACVGAGH